MPVEKENFRLGKYKFQFGSSVLELEKPGISRGFRESGWPQENLKFRTDSTEEHFTILAGLSELFRVGVCFDKVAGCWKGAV